MSAWRGLREERELGRRLARRIAGLFEQGPERRPVRDERFQRGVVRRSEAPRGFWHGAVPLTPILAARPAQGESELGGAGWQVWQQPARPQACSA